MKPSIELSLTKKKRLQLSLELFKSSHYKKEMTRKFLSQTKKKKCTTSPKTYRPIQPKISSHLTVRLPLRIPSHTGKARSSIYDPREERALKSPPMPLDEGGTFAKMPYSPEAAKTAELSTTKGTKSQSTTLDKGELFANTTLDKGETFGKRPHLSGVSKPAELPPAIKELFKSRPTMVCKAAPFDSRTETQERYPIGERDSPPALIGSSDAIPSSCVAPDYPKTTSVTLEKVDPFDTRHHPKFNLNSTTLVKIDFFETSCHHLEIVGQFESRSGAQKKLRSLLQANIPKQVTSSQIRDITVAVKDAIEKATYNL